MQRLGIVERTNILSEEGARLRDRACDLRVLRQIMAAGLRFGRPVLGTGRRRSWHCPYEHRRRVRYPGITHETSTVRRAHEDMRRFRCEIGERHIAVRRFEQYVDSRWRRRLNQNSSQSVRFVWLEPVSLAENHIEIARRSGCRCAGRSSKSTLRPGPQRQPRRSRRGATRASAAKAGTASRRIGWRTERKSVSCSAIPAPQSRRSQGGKALRASRAARLSNLHDRLGGFEGRRGMDC